MTREIVDKYWQLHFSVQWERHNGTMKNMFYRIIAQNILKIIDPRQPCKIKNSVFEYKKNMS